MEKHEEKYLLDLEFLAKTMQNNCDQIIVFCCNSINYYRLNLTKI